MIQMNPKHFMDDKLISCSLPYAYQCVVITVLQYSCFICCFFIYMLVAFLFHRKGLDWLVHNITDTFLISTSETKTAILEKTGKEVDLQLYSWNLSLMGNTLVWPYTQ